MIYYLNGKRASKEDMCAFWKYLTKYGESCTMHITKAGAISIKYSF